MSLNNMSGSRTGLSAAGVNASWISKESLQMVNTIIDPLGAKEPTYITDQVTEKSMCLIDSVQVPHILVDDTPAGGSVSGIFLWLSYGNNLAQTQSGPYTSLVYTLNWFFVSALGDPVRNGTSGKYWSETGVNYSTITGSTTGVDYDAALIQTMRMVSMGLRVLPMIEYVTSSSTKHVSYYVGGQLTAAEIYRALVNNYNIVQMIRNSEHSKSYGNNEGVTVRYSPFQNERQYMFYELSDLLDVNAQSLDSVRLPCVYAEFNSPVAVDDYVPIRVAARFWIEGVIQQPTPIYSGSSPIDLNFDKVKGALCAGGERFPLVTKGHTFTTFMSAANIARSLNDLIGDISGFKFGVVRVRPRPRRSPQKKKGVAYSTAIDLPQRPPRRRRGRRQRAGGPMGSYPNGPPISNSNIRNAR